MKLGLKIILVVLPILIVTILLAGLTSAFSAQNGITRIALEALGFKAQELQKNAESQWELLVANDLAEDEDYLKVTKLGVESYAGSLIRSESELIFGIDSSGSVVMNTSELDVSDPSEREVLQAISRERREGWQEITLAGEDRVGQAFNFEPFDWTILVTDTEDNFYREVESIRIQTYIIVAAAVIIAVILMAIFARVLTGPLSRMVGLVQQITETKDLSQRVEVEYRDEIGALAKKFNGMLVELDSANANIKAAYDKVKQQAYRAEVSQWKEFNLRKQFERYVPKHVIDEITVNPNKAMEGDNRILAILFTDIRSFTTISESLDPDVVVERLNRYFDIMGQIVIRHNGIVDKYIGDALMAFFGAPAKHENDPLDAVMAALEMQEGLKEFQAEQAKLELPPFKTGIGVEYGICTVGNMGFEMKMDYTIIGSKVNSGSRLEGLTKEYGQDVIISESVFSKVKSELPCRYVEEVVVKGQKEIQKVYTARLSVGPREQKAWGYYHKGIIRYHQKDLKEALKYFIASDKVLPDDPLTQRWIKRTREGYKAYHKMESK